MKPAKQYQEGPGCGSDPQVRSEQRYTMGIVAKELLLGALSIYVVPGITAGMRLCLAACIARQHIFHDENECTRRTSVLCETTPTYWWCLAGQTFLIAYIQ